MIPVAAGGQSLVLEGTSRGLNITVLMGGPSSEREVSLVSGQAIASAFERKGHNVRRGDINPQRTTALDAEGIDVVFIAMHGQFGESGQVQELCEARSLPYTGSGQRASELAMDKVAAKRLFRDAGLSTPDWVVIEEYDEREKVKKALAAVPLPAVVKPIDGGSSLDVIIVRRESQRTAALERVLCKYSRAMVEQYVVGREMTVSILADKALPLIEIIPAGKFYDYRSKYSDCGTQYIFDHGLDEEVEKQIRDAVMTAFEVLGCRDFGRVDFLLDEQGIPQILELNTIPGFTSHSLLPMAADRAGIPFDELVDSIVAMAINRPRETTNGAGK